MYQLTDVNKEPSYPPDNVGKGKVLPVIIRATTIFSSTNKRHI